MPSQIVHSSNCNIHVRMQTILYVLALLASKENVLLLFISKAIASLLCMRRRIFSPEN